MSEAEPGVPPIGVDERLYRRLLYGWYKSGRPKPIPQRYFMPRAWVSDANHGDEDGISVNRAALTDLKTASTRPDNGERTDLAEFGVADVVSIGLTVAAKPLPCDPSHAVIPELNSVDLRDPKKAAHIAERALALRDRARLLPRDALP